MKFFATLILSIITIALTRSAPQTLPGYTEGKDAIILDQNFELTPNRSYYFNYLQSDGQKREERATFKPDPKTNEKYIIDKVIGSYEYIRPDGRLQIVNYEADENGFRPKVTVQKKE